MKRSDIMAGTSHSPISVTCRHMWEACRHERSSTMMADSTHSSTSCRQDHRECMQQKSSTVQQESITQLELVQPWVAAPASMSHTL